MRFQHRDKYRFMALIMMKDHTARQRMVLASSVDRPVLHHSFIIELPHALACPFSDGGKMICL